MGLEARLEVNMCVHHRRSFAIVFFRAVWEEGFGCADFNHPFETS